MWWLIITILAYLSLAVVSLFDRYLLVGKIPNPKTYTFYVGLLWILTGLLLIPFGVNFLALGLIILGLAAGFIRILAVLFLVESIKRSEISRTIPAIGGFLPIFSFFLFLIYAPESGIFNLFSVVAFSLLVLGSVLISLKRPLGNSFFSNLKYPMISAFLFASNFFLTKLLFLKSNFINGFSWPLFGGGLGAITFLLFAGVRKDIFSQEISKKITSKIAGIFILGQISGGLGVLLQYYAVFLARASQVPIINALEGIRYVFLLGFVFLLTHWNPNILKEEIAGASLSRKVLAILLIGLGLALLALSQ